MSVNGKEYAIRHIKDLLNETLFLVIDETFHVSGSITLRKMKLLKEYLERLIELRERKIESISKTENSICSYNDEQFSMTDEEEVCDCCDETKEIVINKIINNILKGV